MNSKVPTEVISDLKSMSDAELIQSTRIAVSSELAATTNVVRHFTEVYARMTYAKMGYSSMHRFATKEVGLDKASAQRRVNAMLLAVAVPEVLELIDCKKLFLQAAADIQTFLNKERGARRPYSVAQKVALVKVCCGKSTRKVQRHLASLSPACDFKESKRFVSSDRLQISYTTSVDVEAKLDRLKEVLAHVNPYMSREELIDYIAEIALDKLDPKRKAARVAKRSAKAADKPVVETAAVGDVKRGVELESGSRIGADVSIDMPAEAGPAQVRESEFEICDEDVGDFGEIQLAVRFRSMPSLVPKFSPSTLREEIRSYEGRADLASVCRSRRRAMRPSMRRLAFRRPAEKSASLSFLNSKI